MTDIITIEVEPGAKVFVESDSLSSMAVERSGELVLVESDPEAAIQINQETEVLIQAAEETVNMTTETAAREVIILDGFQIPSDGSVDIAHIELELTLASGTIDRHKVFEYNMAGDLVNQKVYINNTLSQLLYDIDYTYSAGFLSQISVTRVSDAFSYTKTFTYSSGNLISINYV